MFLVCLSSEDSECCELARGEDLGEVLDPHAGLGGLWSSLLSRYIREGLRSQWGSEGSVLWRESLACKQYRDVSSPSIPNWVRTAGKEPLTRHGRWSWPGEKAATLTASSPGFRQHSLLREF